MKLHLIRLLGAGLFLLTLAFIPPHGLADSSTHFDSILRQIPSAEGNRFREILVGVMRNDPAFLSPEVHSEFWSILDRWASIDPNATEASNEEFLRYTRDYFGETIRTYGRIFWEDALWAVTNGRPFKSRHREDLENRLYEEGRLPKFQIQQNERMIERIVRGEPVLVNGEELVLTKELILELLSTLEETAKRVEALFTR